MKNSTAGTKTFLLAACVLFLGAPLLSMKFHPYTYSGGRSRDVENRIDRNSSAFAMMLGEFRTSLGDIIFVKTERYLDNGVAYQPHVDESELSDDEEALELTGEAAADDHDHDHDHAHGDAPKTIIRTKEDDFRGFIGDLHRQVKPWKGPGDHGQHAEGKELLPWLRVVTIADPSYVRAYTTGGWYLKTYDPAQAEVFLLEGIRKNPREFQIHYMLGQVYLRLARNAFEESADDTDPVVLENYRKAAVKFLEAAELGINERPAGWVYTSEWSEEWTDYKEEDLKATIQLGIILEWRYGNLDEAISRARRYDQAIGGNAILKRNIDKMIREKETGIQEWRQAHEQIAPATDEHDHDHHDHDHDHH